MVEISALIRVSFTLFFACSQPRVNRLTVWKLSLASHRLWPEVVLGFWSYFNSRFNSNHWSQLNICIIKLVATRSETHGMKMLVKFIVFHPPHQCRNIVSTFTELALTRRDVEQVGVSTNLPTDCRMRFLTHVLLSYSPFYPLSLW